jgi:hypothetical protein
MNISNVHILYGDSIKIVDITFTNNTYNTLI